MFTLSLGAINTPCIPVCIETLAYTWIYRQVQLTGQYNFNTTYKMGK